MTNNCQDRALPGCWVVYSNCSEDRDVKRGIQTLVIKWVGGLVRQEAGYSTGLFCDEVWIVFFLVLVRLADKRRAELCENQSLEFSETTSRVTLPFLGRKPCFLILRCRFCRGIRASFAACETLPLVRFNRLRTYSRSNSVFASA